MSIQNGFMIKPITMRISPPTIAAPKIAKAKTINFKTLKDRLPHFQRGGSA
jgi:hypothetical protein